MYFQAMHYALMAFRHMYIIMYNYTHVIIHTAWQDKTFGKKKLSKNQSCNLWFWTKRFRFVLHMKLLHVLENVISYAGSFFSSHHRYLKWKPDRGKENHMSAAKQFFQDSHIFTQHNTLLTEKYKVLCIMTQKG